MWRTTQVIARGAIVVATAVMACGCAVMAADQPVEFKYEMAPLNAKDATVYVSPDMPSRWAFIAAGSLPEGVNAWLVLDLPEGLQPVGLCMRRQGVENNQLGPGERIQREGATYFRHQIRVSGFRHEVFLYVATTLAPGTKVGPVYFRGRRKPMPPSAPSATPPKPVDELDRMLGGKRDSGKGLSGGMPAPGGMNAEEFLQAAQRRLDAQDREYSLPVEVIRVHKVRRPPRRLLIGEAWENTIPFLAWPDFERHYTSLGMNLVSLYLNEGPPPRNAALRGFVQRCEKAGIWVSATLSLGFAMDRYARDCTNAVIRTAEGDLRVAPDEISPLCPSYRGELFDRIFLEPMRNVASCGISMVITDYELPYAAHGKGKYTCFCDRCRRKFQEFLAARYPAIPYADPRSFEPLLWPENKPSEETAARYADLHKAWMDFTSDQIAGWFRLKRQALQRACGEYNARSTPRVMLGDYGTPGPWNHIYYRLWYQPKNLANGLDFVMPIYYTPGNPSHARNKAANEMRVARVRWRDFDFPARNMLPWVTAGWTRGGANTSPDQLYCTLLEVLVNGAHGMVFYDGCGMDAADCDVISRVIDAVTPVEDILIDGEHLTAETSDPEAVAHGQRVGDDMVLLISEYGKQKKEIQVSAPVTKPSRVTDLVTGQDLATVAPSANAFRVVLDRQRVVLVHIHADGK